jgi:hypothetical protein
MGLAPTLIFRNCAAVVPTLENPAAKLVMGNVMITSNETIFFIGFASLGSGVII